MKFTNNFPEQQGEPPHICDIPLSDIAVDAGCQSRAAIDPETVEEYAEVLRSGTELPPAVVFFDGTYHWLADGFHRREAHANAGIAAMRCEVRQGTRRDTILYSVGANATHGLRRKSEDKRRAVMTLLDDSEWSQWTDREISRRCAVSPPLVAACRRERLTARNYSDNSKRIYTTKHGTTANMETAAIGRKPTTPEPDTLDNEGCSDFGPESTGEPWASFVAEAGEGMELLRQAKAKLSDIFGYDPRTKSFGEPYAAMLSKICILDSIDTVIRNIAGGLPAEPSDRAPGFLTAHQSEIRNGVRKAGAR